MKRNLNGKTAAAGYIILMALVFPLFMTHYYFNIQMSKSLFFIILTLAALLAAAAFSLLARELDEVIPRLYSICVSSFLKSFVRRACANTPQMMDGTHMLTAYSRR